MWTERWGGFRDSEGEQHAQSVGSLTIRLYSRVAPPTWTISKDW